MYSFNCINDFYEFICKKNMSLNDLDEHACAVFRICEKVYKFVFCIKTGNVFDHVVKFYSRDFLMNLPRTATCKDSQLILAETIYDMFHKDSKCNYSHQES